MTIATPTRDFHAHILPEAHEIPDFMKQEKVFWIEESEGGKFMRWGENDRRPVSHPSFFLDERLRWMEENKIDGMCVYNLSQLYMNDVAETLAQDVLSRHNEYNAQLQNAHPDKIISGVVVNPAYPSHAIAEIKKGIENGLRIVFMCSHYKGEKGDQFTTLGSNPAITEIFDVMNEHKLALEIHPYEMENIINLDANLWNPRIYGMPFLTGLAHQAITAHNYYDTHSDIRFLFAHGGKFSGVSYGRHHQGFMGRQDLFAGTRDVQDSIGAKNIFFDTLTHDGELLHFLAKRHGSSQYVGGLDSPYPLGEFDPSKLAEKLLVPYHVIKEAIREGLIQQAEFDAMKFENGMRRIFGDQAEAAMKRYANTTVTL